MSLLNLVAKLTLDTTEYESSLNKAESSAGGFGEKFGGAMKKVADVGVKAFAAVTTAVGAFGVKSVKTGMEFDKSMSQVAATMGLTTSEMEGEVKSVELAWGKFTGNLRDYAQEIGANTAFSAKQAADALNYMALAGYGVQESMEMLPNVMNLAAAGNMDLARASDMVTDTQTAFGLTIEEMPQLIDEMAKAASTGNTSVEQLGDAFLTVGGLTQELNGGFVTLADGTKEPVSGIQEMEIALTAMANAGIKGSEAGTHMRNMIMKLSSPTEDGAEMMEALGVSVFDAEGNMRSLQEIMGDLNGALGNLTQEEKINAISSLFNARDLSSAEALLNAVSQDWDKIGASIIDSEGAAQQMAETQLDNLAGDITLFKSAVEGAQIAISDKLSPSFRNFVKLGAEGFSNFTKLLKSGDIKGAITSIGTTIGELVTEAVKYIPDLASAGATLISGIFSGIGEALTGSFDQFDFSSIVLPMLVGISGNIRENIGNLVDAGIAIITGIGDGMSNSTGWFSTPVQTIITNLVGTITDNVPKLIMAGTEMLSNLSKGFVSGIPTFLSKALPIISNFTQSIRENAGTVVDAGINIIMNLAQGIIDSLPILLEQLPQIIINIAGVINDNAPKLLMAGWNLILMIIQGIVDAVPTLIANFPKIFEAILAVWSAFNWLNLGKQAITFITNGIKSLVTNIPNALKNIGTSAFNTFKTINWTTLGTDLINKIVNSVLGMFSDIPNALRSIGHSAWDAFVNIDWFSVGSNVIGGIANGIWNGAGRIIEAAKSAASNALNAAKNFLGIKSPSKVFRKEVGMMISEGIALGIEDGERGVNKAIDGMNSDMMFRFGDGFDYSPSIEAVSGVAPVSGDKNVYITNNITVDGAKDPEVYVGQLVRDLELQMRAL